jgi:hypothetical protein
MKSYSRPALLRILALLLACATMFPGCATKKRVDWNSRIGSYTYDQAVTDKGPPDKQATLSDGRTVAEWIDHRSGSGLSIGTGFGAGNVGVGVGHSIGSSRDHTLKLIFNKDGRLESWSKN